MHRRPQKLFWGYEDILGKGSARKRDCNYLGMEHPGCKRKFQESLQKSIEKVAPFKKF